MATPLRDISNQTFGRLTAIRRDGKIGTATAWIFRCTCGAEKRIRMGHVTRGIVGSCGCLHRERCATGLNRRKHGDAKVGQVSRLHNLWRGMLKRCSPNYPDYAGAYRARGITVCAEWLAYEPFKAWAEANGYRDDLTIDRIDNDKGYSPDNCRWADKTTQARNRRTSRHITIDGRTQVLAAWLSEAGITRPAFYGRLQRGWTVEAALTPK